MKGRALSEKVSAGLCDPQGIGGRGGPGAAAIGPPGTGEERQARIVRIGDETGAASLGEAQGFGTEPFVSIKEAQVSVRFWPLLRGAVAMAMQRMPT